MGDKRNDNIMDKIRSIFVNASAANSVVIEGKDDKYFAGMPSEFKIKVLNELNEPLQSMNKSNCLIEARLYQKLKRKPREEERDWNKDISWSQYEKKTMEIKITQFGLCYDGDDTVYIVGGLREGNVDSDYCYKYKCKEDK